MDVFPIQNNNTKNTQWNTTNRNTAKKKKQCGKHRAVAQDERLRPRRLHLSWAVGGFFFPHVFPIVFFLFFCCTPCITPLVSAAYQMAAFYTSIFFSTSVFFSQRQRPLVFAGDVTIRYDALRFITLLLRTDWYKSNAGWREMMRQRNAFLTATERLFNGNGTPF